MNERIENESIPAEIREIYSETVIDNTLHPRNAGRIDDADGNASVIGECGDSMEIWLRVRDSSIRNIKFWTDGCGPTIAAGSMITQLAKGKPIGVAYKLTDQDVVNALGGLPEANQHCAALAADTLKEAIRDYLAFKGQAWRRAYRR